MPLPRIHLSNVPLTGRSAQAQTLTDVQSRGRELQREAQVATKGAAIRRSMSTSTDVVLLHGDSGTGKSYLVESWYLANENLHDDYLLVQGKFESTNQCAGNALDQVILQMLKAIDDDTTKVQDLIEQIGHEELQLLFPLVPSIKRFALRQHYKQRHHNMALELTEVSNSFDSESTHDGMDFDSNPTQQFVYIFRILFHGLYRALQTCSNTTKSKRDLILFLDDLQWAGDAGRNIVQALVADHRFKSVMFILASRSKETVLSDLQEAVGSVHRRLVPVELNNLTCTQVNDMIAQLTQLSLPTTLHLAQIVHDKTQGNPLFVVQFLDVLQRRRLLRYSMTSYQWTWDATEIMSHTDLADNVAAVVREQISTLDADTRRILHVASFLGFSFQLQEVQIVMRNLDRVSRCASSNDQFTLLASDVAWEEEKEQGESSLSPGDSAASSTMSTLLQETTSRGIIDKQSDQAYKFAHDSIHQSFLSMSESDNRFHLHIGWVLLGAHMAFKRDVQKLFAALRVLNPIGEHFQDDESCLNLAKYNLSAAKKARKCSAFVQASGFLAVAITMVEKVGKPWQKNYQLTKVLYRLAAETEATCGRHDACEKHAQEIIENAANVEDKLKGYFVLAESLRARKAMDTAMSTLFSGLKELDEDLRLQPTRLGLFASTRRLQRQIKGMSKQDFLTLPDLRDEKALSKLKFLSVVSVNAYYVNNVRLCQLVPRRMISLTIQHGLCKYAPLAFALYAHQVTASGNFAEGAKFGEIAYQLIDQLQAKENLGLITFYLVAFVNHILNPMQMMIRPLKKAIKVALEVGNPESAFLCATTLVCIESFLSTPLDNLMDQTKYYFDLSRECRQDSMTVEFLLMWQFSANMHGITEDATVFDGKFAEEEELITSATEPGLPIALSPVRYYRTLKAIILAHLNDVEEASEYFRQLIFPDNLAISGSHYVVAIFQTMAATMYFRKNAIKRDARLMVLGDKHLAVLQLWVNKGAMNLTACLWFVQAEKAAVTNSNLSEMKQLFDKAILGLARSSFLGLRASACLGFALCAERHGDLGWASEHMEMAVQLYHEWGAGAVVCKIQQRHGHLLRNLKDCRKHHLMTSKSSRTSRMSSYSDFLAPHEDQ